MTVTISISCALCEKAADLAATHVRRARKNGANLYCSKPCSDQAKIVLTGRRWQPKVRKTFSRNLSIAERLDAQSIPEPNSGCYLWLGPITGRGYGHFRQNKRDILAHRAAYEQAYGPVPEGLFVCHHCDNRACVNPGHLFAGTHKDNMADRDAKGRNVQGPTHPLALIDVPLALAIFAARGKQRDIAEEFGTNQTSVWQIKNRNHWTMRTPDAQAAIDAIENQRKRTAA